MRAFVVMLAVSACGSPGAASTDGGGDDDATVHGDGREPDAPPDTCPINTWCVESSPVAGTLLKSVWAAGLNTVFAVGDNGTILRRRDNVWTTMTSPTS